MPKLTILPVEATDKGWVLETTAEQWHAPQVVVHDHVYYPHQQPGLIAWRGVERIGLVTYDIQGSACEIVSLNAFESGQGTGTALLEAVEDKARQAGCRRLWLVTTNDNLEALAFYQKRGFHLVRVDSGAVDRARRIKPQIPTVGEHGIPMHDEIELDKSLS